MLASDQSRDARGVEVPLFGALNTMYAAVSALSLEIATLRAIGFGAGAVAASVLIEALVLAVCRALLGALVARLFFDGHVTRMTTGFQNVFAPAVTPGCRSWASYGPA